jgi:pyruvate/2-oxoglutarate dehydrogenase complex dihydrolipoamide acyltransferase (E2) component
MKPRTPGKPDSDDDQRLLAVLIDADNAPPGIIEGLLAEVAKYGVASVKRIYGDFTSPQQTQWKKALLKHSIQPVQQFAYTSGKNATDSSLIIDAMDLMYTRRFDGFCLVSSDSDFTRLAQRLREEGHTVYGFGERKTPDPFVQACDKFIYTDLLRREPDAAAPAKPPAGSAAPALAPAKKAAKPAKSTAATATPAPAPAPAPGKPAPPPLPRELLVQAIEEAADDSGWAFLGSVGSYVTKIRPDFDPRLYGHKKLSDLFKAHPALFEMQERGSAGGGKSIHVRLKG